MAQRGTENIGQALACLFWVIVAMVFTIGLLLGVVL